MVHANHTFPVNGEISVESLVLASIVFVIIILSSICGNVLVCAAICTDPHLRQLSNSLYVSLAMADLLVSCLVMTVATIDWIMGQWIFGKVTCNLFISMDIMCSTASILNILATAIDRFVHVHAPFHYSRIFNKTFVGIFIACIWILSAIMSFMPIHLGWHLYNNNTVNPNPNICMLQLNSSYAIVSSFISFYFPCIVMVGLYVKLYRFARKHTSKINENNIIPATSCENHRVIYRKFKNDQKAAVTLGVIMGTFLVCWLPFFIINCVKPICHCIPDWVFIVATWLGYFNSCLNPIIYPLFNTDFRNAYRKLLMRLLCSTGKWRYKYHSSIFSNSITTSNNLNGTNDSTKVIEEPCSDTPYNQKIRFSRSERDPFSPVSQRFKNLYALKRPCLSGELSDLQPVTLSNED